MNLLDLQNQLHLHFAKLRKNRPEKLPIFALEHGLSAIELSTLQEEIRKDIKHSSPSDKHSLSWIVYASEFGYHFSGDEYWQTFEEHTPGWELNGNRYWIRDAFRSFCEKYSGAKPTGIWAKHFSIICWPITHAILPKDLQRQLVNILNELRHSFLFDHFETPKKLGELISAYGWNASSRFQNFAQEAKLVGQIAAALLLQKEQFSETLVLSQTLTRIVADLDRERRTREWLRRAQKHAQKVMIQGIRQEGVKKGEKRVTRDHWRNQIAALSLEPKLILRPVPGNSWNVIIQIPDLSPLLVQFPRLKSFLADSRCVVTGATKRSPLARGQVLYGPQTIVLKEWPKQDEVLIRFEKSSPELEFLLSSDCLLCPGPRWLFRIAADGCAYEIRNNTVRPGNNYIILTSFNNTSEFSNIPLCSIECDGIKAYRLDLPEKISHKLSDTIRRLELSLAARINVWPVGLPPSDWDGEGRGEWLINDRPYLGIQIPYPADSISLELQAHKLFKLDIQSPEPGDVQLIELPQLPPGVSTLRITAKSNIPEQIEYVGVLNVIIREQKIWRQGYSNQGPLFVIVDPIRPSLEQLWEDEIALEIHGPAGRYISCNLSLYEKNSDVPTISKTIPSMQLPINSLSWRSYFEKYFREVKEVQNSYDSANICKLDFIADELGTYSLNCEREFTPVRWNVKKRHDDYFLKLIDDTGKTSKGDISHYKFETPDVSCPVCELISKDELSVPKTGGMYVIRIGKYVRGVVLPPQIDTFQDFNIEPQVSPCLHSLEWLKDYINLYETWAGSRITGNIFSNFRRRKVLLSLIHNIFYCICKKKWSDAEHKFRSTKDDNAISILLNAIYVKPKEKTALEALKTDYDYLSTLPTKSRVKYLSSLIKTYILLPRKTISKVSSIDVGDYECEGNDIPDSVCLEWLIEFVLRLASSPELVCPWAGSQFDLGLEILLDFPIIPKMARFLVLAVERCLLPHKPSTKQIYCGWVWE